MLLLLLPWLPRSCKQCFVLVLGVGRAWSLYSSNHRQLIFAVRFCLLLLLLLLLPTGVLCATSAVVLLSIRPAAAGSGAFFVQKRVCTRAVVLIVVCSRVANARYEHDAT